AGEIADQVRSHHANAVPLVKAREGANQGAFLLVPASDAGKAYGEEAAQVVPEMELVRVPGQAELMFCREQGFLSMEDLQRFLHVCRTGYDESVSVPSISPHARFDILDWVPLDP